MVKKFINSFLSIRNLQSAICNTKRGFTLIELAIVMVIIGIILGAVLKGQDLIANARAKQVVSWEKQWETVLWTYFDRRGVFAGDTDKDGIIAEEASPTSPITAITNASFIKPPGEKKILGSVTLYMKIGNDTDGREKNVMVICPTDNCGTTIAPDELLYFESIDTAIDGIADAGAGNVRAIIVAPTLESSNDSVDEVTEDTSSGDWTTSHYGLVYYFDRPHS